MSNFFTNSAPSSNLNDCVCEKVRIGFPADGHSGWMKMKRDVTIAERVLLALLNAAAENRGAAMLATNRIADGIGVPLTGLAHVIPVLYEHGWLDQNCPAGTLKLSDSGMSHARALADMPGY